MVAAMSAAPSGSRRPNATSVPPTSSFAITAAASSRGARRPSESTYVAVPLKRKTNSFWKACATSATPRNACRSRRPAFTSSRPFVGDVCAYAHSVNAPSCVTFPPVDDETLAAWRALLNAHAAVTARVEAALTEANLPPLTWYDALWPLYRAERRRLRIGALASEVTLSRTGLSRLVDRLEREGLIRREAAPEDRRGFY